MEGQEDLQISQKVALQMKIHYSRCFEEHGPTSSGVDWGKNSDLELRYEKMLDVLVTDESIPTLLDVGCGFGGMYAYSKRTGKQIHYHGIDLCEQMIAHGKTSHPDAEFECGDFVSTASRKADYVVCNGILTQKLSVSHLEMEEYARKLITLMFQTARIGIAFNVMTTKVNFMAPNLFYKSPVEMLSFCMENLTSKVRLDHSYPLYEYTVYAYH